MRSAPSNQTSMRRRVLGAGFCSLAGYAASYLIRLGSSLITTRLLVPEMFGVIAVAMSVMTALGMFSDVGLGQNIIQSRRGGNPDYLNTGVLHCLLGLCFALEALVASSFGWVPEASVYADPHLPPVIAVVSLGAAIGGVQSTKFAEASRHLSLRRVTQIGIVAQIVGLVCTIGWALMERSIWALVARSLCSTSITVLLSHLSPPGAANQLRWDRSAVHEIVHFSK